MGKNNKETIKAWRLRNLDKINAQRRKRWTERADELNSKRRNRLKTDIKYQERKKELSKLNYQRNKEFWTKYRLKNKDIINHKCRIRNKSIKMEVLNYYSNGSISCNCCDEKELEFLSIDHIDGGGKKLRNIQGVGTNLYKWLKRNEFPKGFQVLCMNCNFAKGKIGICPHQIKSKLEVKI